jgi:CRP/FNR family transcriptional regulator
MALEDASAYALPVRELPGLRLRCPMLDSALQNVLSRQLARSGEVAEMMAAVVSDVRLVRFLLWYSSRMEALGQSPSRFVLRMCRRDIASLLGVAPETISRSFTTLADEGYLSVRNREVELLDIERLRQHGRCTRGLLHAAGSEESDSLAHCEPAHRAAWFSSIEPAAAA